MKTYRFYGKECGCNCDGHDESCEIFVPLTNADRIRSMSDEGLAEDRIFFLDSLNVWVTARGIAYGTKQEAIKGELKYLKQEVSE